MPWAICPAFEYFWTFLMWKVCLNQKMRKITLPSKRYSDLCMRVIKVLLSSTTYTLTGSLEIDYHVLSNS